MADTSRAQPTGDQPSGRPRFRSAALARCARATTVTHVKKTARPKRVSDDQYAASAIAAPTMLSTDAGADL